MERTAIEAAGVPCGGQDGGGAEPWGARVSAGFRLRAPERHGLLLVLPLALLGAGGVAAAQPQPAAALLPALQVLGGLWLACAALHLLLCVARFDGDPQFLPLLAGLLLIGGAYHADLRGPATPGLTPTAYLSAAYTCLVVLGMVTAGGRALRKASLLLEERVWWRLVGARPYYESIPFHLLLLGGMLCLLLLLKLGGVRGEGGSLVRVPLPFGQSFTPSEFVRLAVAFFLADYLGRNATALRNLRRPLAPVWPLRLLRVERRAELGVVLLTVGLYCAFFYVFRDFGPAVVIVVLTLGCLFAATNRPLTPLLLGGALALAIVLSTWSDFAFHTLRNRVEMWLNPWDTDFRHGDHLARILWSIAAGGWFGMGAGSYDLAAQLPLARNDAAFAGVAASMGMYVGLAVLGLYAALTWRGLLAARRAGTDRSRLLAFALTALLALQAVWIAGAMVRVFPFTGINLPFISTGLSSMVASALALGTLWNLSRPPHPHRPADATAASPEVLRALTRLAVPLTATFALPAALLVLHGCPWLLADRVLARSARGVGRQGERTTFVNPYLEAFRRRFPRGRIFSADGRLLAFSSPSDAELTELRRDLPEFAAMVERSAGSAPPGTRYYPLGAAAAQLVGWNPHGEFMAREGSVETAFDGPLRGYDPGRLPHFFRLRHNPLATLPTRQDLQLTVDSGLQQRAHELLARAARSAGAAGGAVLVYDAATGAVLCAATAPSFDPNGLNVARMRSLLESDPRTRVLTNKALARDALYFPGSTFKVLTAAALLELGDAASGSITCRNGRNAEALAWEYGGRSYRREPGRVSDYGRAGHGALGLRGGLADAMAFSCNVFFARAAVEVEPELLARTMRAAELRAVPSLRELAEHLPAAGFGQVVVKTSPVELAMVAAAVAVARAESPGMAAARPHWVQAVVSRGARREPDGVPGAPDRSAYRPFPDPVARRLRELMVGVVQRPEGTAHAAFYREGAPRLPGITVGGKTGTAEFDRPARGAERPARGRHVWFMGFARSDHEVEPRTLAFAVLLEDVRRGVTGGSACAPLARELLQEILPAPGAAPRPEPPGLERFLEEQIRSRLGPLGALLDALRGRRVPR